MVTKEIAKKLIDGLPDDASIDDIIHALYVHAKFQHGEEQIRKGESVPHEQAREKLRKWVR